MNNSLRATLAAAVVAVVALYSAGPANADNSNANTNTNDVTNLGGDGADAGAASGNESTNWPPTDLSWPPSAVTNGDISSKNNDNSATPIVMPVGQDAPTKTSTTGSPETTKPIVPIDAP